MKLKASAVCMVEIGNQYITCYEYIASIKGISSCEAIPIHLIFDLRNNDNFCISISDIKLIEVESSLKEVFNVAKQQLCPGEKMSMHQSRSTDLCPYSGRNVEFELKIKDNKSNIVTRKTFIDFQEFNLQRPSTGSCTTPFSTMTFVYEQRRCEPRTRPHQQKRNRRSPKQVSKGYFEEDMDFQCKDFNYIRSPTAAIFVSSGSSRDFIFSGEISEGGYLDIKSEDVNYLTFLIYSTDGELIQSIFVEGCKLNDKALGTSFGSINMVSMRN